MQDPSQRASTGTAPTPPYAAYATFEALLQRAAQEPVPARLDKALLQEWGIAAKNESALLTSLRALGLVDEEGAPSYDYKELRLSPPRRLAALRRALERAYPGLAGGGAYSLDPNRLRDYFVAERGLSGQMVEKATRFYRRLVGAVSVGPPVLESATSSPPRVAATTPPSAGVAREAEEGERWGRERRKRRRPTGGSEVHLTVHVQVPFEASEEELRRFFERVRRAWGDGGPRRG